MPLCHQGAQRLMARRASRGDTVARHLQPTASWIWGACPRAGKSTLPTQASTLPPKRGAIIGLASQKTFFLLTRFSTYSLSLCCTKGNSHTLGLLAAPIHSLPFHFSEPLASQNGRMRLSSLAFSPRKVSFLVSACPRLSCLPEKCTSHQRACLSNATSGTVCKSRRSNCTFKNWH